MRSRLLKQDKFSIELRKIQNEVELALLNPKYVDVKFGIEYWCDPSLVSGAGEIESF